MYFFKFKISILAIFILFLTQAVTIAQSDSLVSRPKIGLVLSGGGAKGMAEIGTLKLIEKYNIPIDYVTGTSMGSIVGALYAMGYSADNIEQIARNMKWQEMFTGDIKRRLISIEEKDEEGKYLLEVPVKKGKPIISTGLISGQKIEMELAKITWSAHNISDFSKLPIPFACVATDIVHGKPILLNKGYLPDALRASMAIPSILSAVELDGNLLVDGGLVNNFPVSYAKQMGADIIIGVIVQSKLYKKKELNSMLKVMEQAASFENERVTKKEIKDVDLLVEPDIEGYDAGSFAPEDVDTLFARGYEAALAKEEAFKELSEKLKNYKDKRKPIIAPTNLYSIFIDKVKYEGLKKVSKGLVASKLQIKDSTWVTLKDIERGVAMVYGSKYFEKVNYRIIQENNLTTLIIKVAEQAFSIYKIGANFNNYFNTSLLLNGTYRNILGEGSKLLLNAKLGFQTEFSADYSIFTNLKPSIGFNTKIQYYNIEETFFNFTDSIDLRVQNDVFEGNIGLASTLSNSLLFGAGLQVFYKSVRSQDVRLSFEKPYRSAISTYAFFKMDTYDVRVYTNEGTALHLAASYVFGELNKTDDYFDKKYWKFLANYSQYFRIGKRWNYRHLVTAAATLNNNIFFSDRYFLGGAINFKDYIFPLEGFRFMEIMGQNIASVGVSLRFEPWNGKFIFINGNSGIAENTIKDMFNPNKFYFGASFGVGMRTVIGPVEYKISVNSLNNEINHWLQIGYSF